MPLDRDHPYLLRSPLRLITLFEWFTSKRTLICVT